MINGSFLLLDVRSEILNILISATQSLIQVFISWPQLSSPDSFPCLFLISSGISVFHLDLPMYLSSYILCSMQASRAPCDFQSDELKAGLWTGPVGPGPRIARGPPSFRPCAVHSPKNLKEVDHQGT